MKRFEIRAIKDLRTALKFAEAGRKPTRKDKAAVVISQRAARQILLEVETLDVVSSKYAWQLEELNKAGARIPEWKS